MFWLLIVSILALAAPLGVCSYDTSEDLTWIMVHSALSCYNPGQLLPVQHLRARLSPAGCHTVHATCMWVRTRHTTDTSYPLTLWLQVLSSVRLRSTAVLAGAAAVMVGLGWAVWSRSSKH